MSEEYRYMPRQANGDKADNKAREGAGYERVPLFPEPGDSKDGDPYIVNAIIESPRGHRNKFKYEEKFGLFVLSKVLPQGSVFPFDFGFLPHTKGDDGDPLDVLVLMDEPAFTGCVVQVRLIGVIEAEQTERDGTTTRNDRLIAVAADSHNHSDITSLHGLNEHLVEEIEHFFVSYNSIAGKKFKPIGRFAAGRALKLVQDAATDEAEHKK
jgi:inorganic pyrophosphatase